MKNNIFKTFFNLCLLYLRNAVYFISSLFPYKQSRIIIYCYHSISDDNWRFSVSKSNFEEQIRLLLKDYTPLKLSDLNNYLIGTNKIDRNYFIITFDDGYKDILQVKDFLNVSGIYPTVFLMSDIDNTNRNELETNRDFLNNDDVLSLMSSGWEIGSHSSTHENFATLNKIELKRQIFSSKEELEKKYNIKVNYFSYPKGKYNSEIIKLVKEAGYAMGFSMDDSYVSKFNNKYIVPRVGVDGSHSIKSFERLALPLSMKFRSIAKKII